MNAPTVVPRDVSRDFCVDEMFFSTTDHRGVITAGNEVFVRVSGYAVNELIGRAHNIVRHPDMPRAAFRLVWRYLLAGRRIAAVVKNRAKDGSHYWVVSSFAPVGDGFVSIRFKPTSQMADAVQTLYTRMLAEERRLKEEGVPPDAAMDAAERLLTEGVQAHGFADYDGFMRALLCEELKSRDATLQREGRTIICGLPEKLSAGSHDGRFERLRVLYQQGAHVYAQLSRLHSRLDDFVTLQRALEGKSRFVADLTRELRLAAMNVSLASSRLKSGGQGLGVISHYMGDASSSIANAVNGLTSGIQSVSGRLRSVIFNLAVGRLQLEMILIFLRELIVAESSAEKIHAQHALIETLQRAFRRSLDRATAALDNLDGSAHQLNITAHDLRRQILGLHVAQLGGSVETNRLSQQAVFSPVFTHIREQIEGTQSQLGELGDALGQLDALAREAPETARDIAGATSQMEQDVTGLAAM